MRELQLKKIYLMKWFPAKTPFSLHIKFMQTDESFLGTLWLTKDPRLFRLTVYSYVFDLITAHAPISAQSSLCSQCTFICFVIKKTYVVGTHLNCLDKSVQTSTHNIDAYAILFSVFFIEA